MPKVSRATRAAMMLELSPELTAAKASARSMPASTRVSRSKPMPVTRRPENSVDSRRNAPASRSMMATECPPPSRIRASVEPTRPHPMITTCMRRNATRAAPLVFLLVPGIGDLTKRVLLGRALRSDRLGETLLPKKIALPVFASDALSSVAYAPDEIFLTLSIAGLAAYSYSWKIGLAVAAVMLVVVASYRQNVHAYPSGGGDYEVAGTNLGPRFGLTVAAALLVDYVLTVAVSVSSGVQNASSAVGFVKGKEALVACGLVLLL